MALVAGWKGTIPQNYNRVTYIIIFHTHPCVCETLHLGTGCWVTSPIKQWKFNCEKGTGYRMTSYFGRERERECVCVCVLSSTFLSMEKLHTSRHVHSRQSSHGTPFWHASLPMPRVALPTSHSLVSDKTALANVRRRKLTWRKLIWLLRR
jgi:hypothetical protein